MDIFSKAAGFGAIDLTLFGKEWASQQRGLTLGTGEACFCGVPVLPIVGHLSVVHTCSEKKENQHNVRCDLKKEMEKNCTRGNSPVMEIS